MTIIELNLFSYHNKFGIGNEINWKNGKRFFHKNMISSLYWGGKFGNVGHKKLSTPE